MKIDNATCKWAKVYQPDTKYTPRWSIDIYPDAKGLKVMEGAGLEMLEDRETGEAFYKTTRNVATKAGKQLSPPRVVNMNKEPITDLIGNGSKVNVIMNVKEVDNFGKKKMKGYLEAVQVVDLVNYSGGEDFDDASGNTEEF